jgi:caffeoyl-CoA O-methyltransferase
MLIDSEKNEYAQYFKILLDDNLLVFNGLICVRNRLSQGQVYLPPKAQTENGETITCFNRIVKDNPQIEQVLLPIRDGLTIPVASVGKHKRKGRSASPCLLNL